MTNTDNNVTLSNGVTYQTVQYFRASDVWSNHPRSRYAYRCSDEDGSNRCYAPSFRAAKALCPDRITRINRQGLPVCRWERIRFVNSRGQYFRYVVSWWC